MITIQGAVPMTTETSFVLLLKKLPWIMMFVPPLPSLGVTEWTTGVKYWTYSKAQFLPRQEEGTPPITTLTCYIGGKANLTSYVA